MADCVRGVPQNAGREFQMSNDTTATPEAKVTLSVQRLESIKKYPLYEGMQDILERKKSGQLKFHTHEKIWNE